MQTQHNLHQQPQSPESKKSSQPDFDYTLKLIIIGDSGVGKSSIMLRYNQNKFVQNYMMTIGINYVAKTVAFEDIRVRLQIWDTAGQDKYKTITKNYYRKSQGAIVAYSITSRESFESMRAWIDELTETVEQGIQIVIVGAKKDLEEDREVSRQQAQELANNFSLPYIQCSAKSGQSINELFSTLGLMMKHKFIDLKIDVNKEQEARMRGSLVTIDDYQTASKKIICAKFANKNPTNFAAGDEQNNILVYSVSNMKPISMFNICNNGILNTSKISAITALTYTNSDDVIIGGSNRGSMIAWDLNSGKMNYCLKGHTIEICSLSTDNNNNKILASGSADTNAKLWDIRLKNCIYTYRNHKKRVSVVHMSRYSPILLTGSEDGTVCAYDYRIQKPVSQFQDNAHIMALDCNSIGVVAVGCGDRVARIYQMNQPMSNLRKTKNQSMPIVSCLFHSQTQLFTAATDSLKLWENAKSGITLNDNIQSGSKGILTMAIGDQCTQQLAYSSGVLSYHQCLFSQISFSGEYSYNCVAQNNSIYPAEKKQVSLKETALVGNKINKRGSSLKITRKTANNFPKNNLNRKLLEKPNQNPSNKLPPNFTSIESQIQHRQTTFKTPYSFPTRQHLQFMQAMTVRSRAIYRIMTSFNNGNIKDMAQIVERCDMVAVSGCLGLILGQQMEIDEQMALIFVRKSKQMIKDQCRVLMKSGLEYLLNILTRLKYIITQYNNSQSHLLQQKTPISQIISIYIQLHKSQISKLYNIRDGKEDKDLIDPAFRLQNQLNKLFDAKPHK